MASYELAELSWPQVAQTLGRDPRLIFVVGAMDQHGPHLPLGANVLIAERVARRVSQELRILRAPTFSYGVSMGGGPYQGVTGLRRKTLHRTVNELLAGWEDCGIQDFVVITAHRFEPHLEALLMALTPSATTSVYDLYQIEVGDILESDREAEHGGELETSLMLHLAPDLVSLHEASDVLTDAKTLRRYTRGRVPTPPVGSRGIVGHPSRASAEKGRRIFERYVSALSDELRRAAPANDAGEGG